MLTNVSSDIFSNSKSISIKPMVFAEWNQNIYNSPYITVAGDGTKQTNITTSTTLTNVTGALAKPGFTTKQFSMTDDGNTIVYTVTPSSASSAFKIISYIKTNKDYPIMANIFGSGSVSQYGSTNKEINSSVWEKIEFYIGGASDSDNITSFTYTIALNRISSEDDLPINIIFTEPEIYPVTFFDYKYNSVYPTDSVFTNFRPGESYVNTGSSLFSFPENFRELGQGGSYICMPTSSISRNPSFIPVSPPTTYYKNALVSDMSQYKYFISDTYNKSITGLYSDSGITANKLVLKFNTLTSIPSFNILINGTAISVDGSQTISLAANANKEDNGNREVAGVLVLYWNGSAWTRTRWSTMPTIGSSGSITQATTINKITVTYVSHSLREEFASIKNRMSEDELNTEYFDDDVSRLQVIEISPRVEIDLTPYLLDFTINKSMDNKSTPLPISSMNSNDATINLSSIPLGNSNQPIPIFSNQSNYAGSALKNMLGKNVKMYTNYYLESYSSNSSMIQPGSLIPGGIFYSDVWSENDANQVSIQCYDITRYLQAAPISDYVSSKQNAYYAIANMLDLSGFTDYDDISLYNVVTNRKTPVDLAYFYVNSKDTTIIDALNKIFLPYQIVAYIDEYGVMNFSALADLINPSEPDLIIDDSIVLDNGYSVTNKAKPGKISIRYRMPKIKQSPALQNARLDESSPSFIYTTSNDVVWSQQNSDSVGMNYLANNMTSTQNFFVMDNNDLLDIFHTYNLNAQGYAVIENEIVSFEHKEYSLTSDAIREELQPDGPVLVSVKNDIELESAISEFNKKYQVGLKTSDGITRPTSSTTIEPTGKITKVQRGMFGSKVSAHTVLDESNVSGKAMRCRLISNTDYTVGGTGTYDVSSDNEFLIETPAFSTDKIILFPSSERSTVVVGVDTKPYGTYSTKIRLSDTPDKSSGGLFFNLSPSADTDLFLENGVNGTYFLELVKYNTFKADGITPNSPKKFNYLLAFYTVTSNVANIIAYTDVTTVVRNIIKNTEKVLEKVIVGNKEEYVVKNDPRYEYFHLKATTFKSTGTDGESTSVVNLLSVFLNNNEIKGWQQYTVDGWVPLDRNSITNLPKKIQLLDDVDAGTIFGSFISADPINIDGITYIDDTSVSHSGSIREIYATYKPLKERSVNYYFQTKEFLDGIVQGHNLFSNSKSYMMQTKPEVLGINTYDVQYTTPAAIAVNVWPIHYLINYFPGTGPDDQRWMQSKDVDKYSLSYSTILNTGFRAKFAIANNTSHMVYLMKDADQSKQTTVRLNLWTHEIITASNPDVIEKIIDPGNISESIQLDSDWIQSKEAANKLMSTITNGIEYFSKDVNLDIFGNPLVQIGDRVQLTYPLAGIKDQVYVVTSVSHDFSNGLGTKLGLTMINPGTSY